MMLLPLLNLGRFERKRNPQFQRLKDEFVPIRLWFKEHYGLAITDERYCNATDFHVALDFLMYLAWKDEQDDMENFDEEDMDALTKLEQGKIDWDEFERISMEKLKCSAK